MPNPVHWIDPLGLMVDNKNKEDHTGGLKGTNLLNDLPELTVNDPVSSYQNPTGNDFGEGVQIAGKGDAIKGALKWIFGKSKSKPDSKKEKPKTKELSAEQQKAIKSYQKRITEHEQKLADYKANPDKFDNKGLLKNAPNKQVRQRIIDGRIRHLEKEIKTFKENIDKILNGG